MNTPAKTQHHASHRLRTVHPTPHTPPQGIAYYVRVAAVKDWAEPLALASLHAKAVTALCWGGQAGVGAGGTKSYLVSCSLDRSCKVVGV